MKYKFFGIDKGVTWTPCGLYGYRHGVKYLLNCTNDHLVCARLGSERSYITVPTA